MSRARLSFFPAEILLALASCSTLQSEEPPSTSDWPVICSRKDFDSLPQGAAAVYLDCESLAPEDLRLLAHHPGIKEIDARRCSDNADAVARELGQLQQLRSVGMPRASLTDEGLAFLCRLPNLEVLNLEACDFITGTGFAALPPDSRLRELNLYGAHGLRGLPFPEGIDFGELRTLNLSHCYMLKREAWLTIAKLRRLDGLFLENCPELGENANALAGLRGLRILILFNTWVTDASVPSIVGMEMLEDLNLSCADISDEGLTRIVSSLPRLKGLDLSGMTSISDEGIARVSRCIDLVSLDLAATRFRGPALDKIAALPRLRYLSMSGCEHVETRWLMKLAGMKSLRILHLPMVGSPERAKRLIAELQAMLSPECDISGSDY